MPSEGEIEVLDGISYKYTRHILDTTSLGTYGYVCQSCGAIIGDGPIHSRWHNDGSP